MRWGKKIVDRVRRSPRVIVWSGAIIASVLIARVFTLLKDKTGRHPYRKNTKKKRRPRSLKSNSYYWWRPLCSISFYWDNLFLTHLASGKEFTPMLCQERTGRMEAVLPLAQEPPFALVEPRTFGTSGGYALPFPFSAAVYADEPFLMCSSSSMTMGPVLWCIMGTEGLHVDRPDEVRGTSTPFFISFVLSTTLARTSSATNSTGSMDREGNDEKLFSTKAPDVCKIPRDGSTMAHFLFLLCMMKLGLMVEGEKVDSYVDGSVGGKKENTEEGSKEKRHWEGEGTSRYRRMTCVSKVPLSPSFTESFLRAMTYCYGKRDGKAYPFVWMEWIAGHKKDVEMGSSAKGGVPRLRAPSMNSVENNKRIDHPVSGAAGFVAKAEGGGERDKKPPMETTNKGVTSHAAFHGPTRKGERIITKDKLAALPSIPLTYAGQTEERRNEKEESARSDGKREQEQKRTEGKTTNDTKMEREEGMQKEYPFRSFLTDNAVGGGASSSPSFTSLQLLFEKWSGEKEGDEDNPFRCASRFHLTIQTYWNARAVWLRRHYPPPFSWDPSKRKQQKKSKSLWKDMWARARIAEHEALEARRSFVQRVVADYVSNARSSLFDMLRREEEEGMHNTWTRATTKGDAGGVPSEVGYPTSCSPRRWTRRRSDEEDVPHAGGLRRRAGEAEEEKMAREIASRVDVLEKIQHVPVDGSWISCYSSSSVPSPNPPLELSCMFSFTRETSTAPCNAFSVAPLLEVLAPHDVVYHTLSALVSETVRLRPRDIVMEAVRAIRRGDICTVGELAYMLCLVETPSAYYYEQEVLELWKDLTMAKRKMQQEEGMVRERHPHDENTGRHSTRDGVQPYHQVTPPDHLPFWPSPIRSQSFVISFPLRHYIDEGFLAVVSPWNRFPCPYHVSDTAFGVAPNVVRNGSSSSYVSETGNSQTLIQVGERRSTGYPTYHQGRFLTSEVSREELQEEGGEENEDHSWRKRLNTLAGPLDAKVFLLFQHLSLMQRGFLQILKRAAVSVDPVKDKQHMSLLQQLWSALTAAYAEYRPLPPPPLPSSWLAEPIEEDIATQGRRTETVRYGSTAENPIPTLSSSCWAPVPYSTPTSDGGSPFPEFQRVHPWWGRLGFPSDDPGTFYALPFSAARPTSSQDRFHPPSGVETSAAATAPPQKGPPSGSEELPSGCGELGLSILQDFAKRYPQECGTMLHYNQQRLHPAPHRARGRGGKPEERQQCYSIAVTSATLLSILLVPLGVASPVLSTPVVSPHSLYARDLLCPPSTPHTSGSPLPFYETAKGLSPIWGIPQFFMLYDRVWYGALYHSFQQASSTGVRKEGEGGGSGSLTGPHLTSSSYASSTTTTNHDLFHSLSCKPSAEETSSPCRFCRQYVEMRRREPLQEEREDERKEDKYATLPTTSEWWNHFPDKVEKVMERWRWWIPPSSTSSNFHGNTVKQSGTCNGVQEDLPWSELKSHQALQNTAVEGFYELHHQLLRHFHECWVQHVNSNTFGSNPGAPQTTPNNSLEEKQKSSSRESMPFLGMTSRGFLKQFIEEIVVPTFFFPLSSPSFSCLTAEK